MALVEETLQSVLVTVALSAGRSYAVQAPDSPIYPHIVYQNITNVPTLSLTNATIIERTRMQIDGWSKTYPEAKALANQIEAALKAAAVAGVIQNWRISKIDDYQADVKVFRVMLEFALWH